jgi:hypothetical protein
MSKIEVDAIDKQSGSTLTLGGSGTAVTLACGATQTGFGRTGTVNWDTTAKTASFTAVSGQGFFVNTTSSAITVTLPASPSAGDIVAVMDYANTAETNNITVGRNSSKIDGQNIDGKIDTNGQSFTLVYVDSTEGWKTVNNANQQITTQKFVTATGGTITTSGNFKIHTFTGPGTFCVSCAGNAEGSNSVDYMVVAGGGGGGSRHAGGGGAGGYRESSGAASGCYTASPLGSSVSALSVPVTSYPITVGGGGAGGPSPSSAQHGSSGSNSVFSTITSAGGGFGGGPSCTGCGGAGGSGGGGGNVKCGGAGNTPPVSPPQGNPGGSGGLNYNGNGGGGAGAAGSSAGCTPGGGPGGNGVTSSINGTPTARAGGGGGSSYCGQGIPGPGGSGGSGGGGAGGNNAPGTNGTTNTGGGGGAGASGDGGNPGSGGTGGSGIVIIRYKFQ